MAQFVTGSLVVNGATVTYRLELPRGCADQPNGAPDRRVIIHPHGHGGSSLFVTQMGNAAGGGSDHPRAWADAGYVVGCIDNANEFFNNDALDRQNALIDHLVNVLGCKPKVGLGGMSMGGGTTLAMILLYPARVACAFAFAPATDLKWLDGFAGYVPPYSTVGADPPSPTWATELTADYPSGFTAHDPMQNIAAFRGGIPLRITHATDDNIIPYAGSRYFVDQVADPHVTFRQPDVLGGHSTTFMGNIPVKETINFFKNNWVD